MELLFSFFLWVLCGVIGATIATNRGHAGCAWFAFGFAFGPLAFVLALVVPKNQEALEARALQCGERKKCPACAELVRIEATKCRFCGESFDGVHGRRENTAELRRATPAGNENASRVDIEEAQRVHDLAAERNAAAHASNRPSQPRVAQGTTRKKVVTSLSILTGLAVIVVVRNWKGQVEPTPEQQAARNRSNVPDFEGSPFVGAKVPDTGAYLPSGAAAITGDKLLKLEAALRTVDFQECGTTWHLPGTALPMQPDAKRPDTQYFVVRYYEVTKPSRYLFRVISERGGSLLNTEEAIFRVERYGDAARPLPDAACHERKASETLQQFRERVRLERFGGALMSDSSKDSPKRPSKPVAQPRLKTPSPNSSGSGTVRRINGNDRIGCISEDNYKELLGYAVEEDMQAFSRALLAAQLRGQCVVFAAGEAVYLTDTAIFSGLIQVRRQGDTNKYWTAVEAV